MKFEAKQLAAEMAIEIAKEKATEILNEKMESVAEELLKNGVSDELVVQSTGLSIEKVRKIKQKSR
jgi:hypothetical protein